jgi:hypothetical protein
MKRLLLVLVLFAMPASLLAQDSAPTSTPTAKVATDSTPATDPQAAPIPKPAEPQERMFFPKDWYWGWAQFDLAPPHNEVDPNMCAANAGQYGGKNAQCSAFARYMISGTIELRPFGQTWLRGDGFLRSHFPLRQECAAVSLHMVVERDRNGICVGCGVQPAKAI